MNYLGEERVFLWERLKTRTVERLENRQNCASPCRTHINANFRQNPTRDPTSVLGVVAYRDSVQLTGRTMQFNGVVWSEAIAPILYPSLDALVQPRIEPSQKGWIANCFVDA